MGDLPAAATQALLSTSNDPNKPKFSQYFVKPGTPSSWSWNDRRIFNGFAELEAFSAKASRRHEVQLQQYQEHLNHVEIPIIWNSSNIQSCFSRIIFRKQRIEGRELRMQEMLMEWRYLTLQYILDEQVECIDLGMKYRGSIGSLHKMVI